MTHPLTLRRCVLLFAIALCAAASPTLAVQPDEILADTAMEARARSISGGLRCLVCQNQSIDDSDAPLAKDLRLLVRERLQAGDSDSQVREYLVARYGEFVLLKPPFSWSTIILWGAPFVILFGAMLLALRTLFSSRSKTVAAALSPAEQDAFDKLMADRDEAR